jgi:hypothetical protein
MNLVSLCLKIPNLGILIFYLIFVVILPYILVLNGSTDILKFYLPMLVAFANLLSKVGNRKIFENLYDLHPDNFVSFLSSNFINLFALFGILWQCLEYSKTSNGTVTKAVIYGTILFIIAFPFARNGLTFVLDHVDFYLREKTDLTYRHNWHLLVFGLLYIIFLLGIQAVLLNLVDSTDGKKDILNVESKIKSISKTLSGDASGNSSSSLRGNSIGNSSKNNRKNNNTTSDISIPPRFRYKGNTVNNKKKGNGNTSNSSNEMIENTVETTAQNITPRNNKNKVRNAVNNKMLSNIGSVVRKLRK